MTLSKLTMVINKSIIFYKKTQKFCTQKNTRNLLYFTVDSGSTIFLHVLELLAVQDYFIIL